MARKKAADRVKEIFNTANNGTRNQWQYINQKGEDFANDNQLTVTEKNALEEAGMPTFTINRIIPITTEETTTCCMRKGLLVLLENAHIENAGEDWIPIKANM